MSVAAIGDTSFITAFEFMGAYGFLAEEEGEVKNVLRRLLNEDEKFKIIIISERFAKATLEMRFKIVETGRVYPLFAIVPDIKGRARGERVKEIKSFISRAIGVELK